MRIQKKPGISATVGVLCLFVCSNPVLLIMPGLAKIAGLFPGVPYTAVTLLTSIISLLAFPVSLVSGIVVGRYIRYKTVSIAAMLCIVIGGVMPFFLTNFYAVVAMRALVGVGVGLMFPLGNPVLMRLYDEKKATVFMGVGSAIINLFGVFLLLLGGVISDYNVKFIWLAHTLWLVPLLLVFLFMPEPGGQEVTKAAARTAKGRLNYKVYLTSLAFMVIMMCSYCANINLSLIIETAQLGTSATAGVVSALYTAGGVAAGVAFAPLMKAFGRFQCPLMAALAGAGLLVAAVGQNIPSLMIGMFLGGFAIYSLSPACIKLFGNTVAPEELGLASGIFSACWNLGGFLSTPFMGAVAAVSGNSSPRLPLAAGAVILALLCVLWFLLAPAGKRGPSAKRDII